MAVVAAFASDGRHYGKPRLAVSGREAAVRVENRSSPLVLIALELEPLDALIQRNGAGDFVTNRLRTLETDPRAIHRTHACHHVAEDLPLGPR